jgi:hypothetical protein
MATSNICILFGMKEATAPKKEKGQCKEARAAIK